MNIIINYTMEAWFECGYTVFNAEKDLAMFILKSLSCKV